MKEKYSLGDLSIVPSEMTMISSRSQCKTTYSNGQSPFFVAPMDTVIDLGNFNYFLEAGTNVCMPRGLRIPINYENKTKNLVFESYGLDEFEKLYCDPVLKRQYATGDKTIVRSATVLIDIANGHMQKLFHLCQTAKSIWGSLLTLMVGNIANPKTIIYLAESGVDYVRLSIGSGSACTTTTHTGVHYPMASLIQECMEEVESTGSNMKLVADGGIKSTSDINIALACGADFVMMGGMYNQCIEACAKTYWKGIKLPKLLSLYMYEWGFRLKKNYRGMSTQKVQKSWGKTQLKLSEGLYKKNIVRYDLESLVFNFNQRLRSAMSYTNCSLLEEYTSGLVKLIKKTNDTNNRINKLK